MRKPFLTIALIVVIRIFAMSAGVFAGEFSDIEEGAWYEKYVETLLMPGSPRVSRWNFPSRRFGNQSGNGFND